LLVDASGIPLAVSLTGGNRNDVTQLIPQGPKLTVSDELGGSEFGHSVALSGDASTILVGGPNDNSANGAAWAFAASFPASDTDLAIGPPPADINTPATSTAGATVTYTAPTASDGGGEIPQVSCGPASGSRFPVGTTRVTCTATDTDDTPSSVSNAFNVTVFINPPTSKVNVRFHYSADGSPGGWSATKTVSSSGAITIGPQAMEGNLLVKPGGTPRVGYDFTMPGSHPATTLGFFNTTVSFQAVCASGSGGGTISVKAPDQQYTDPLNSPSWYPSGNQQDPSVYQGSITVPDLCSGGTISLKQGGTFSATAGAL
jgi:hypothetical protein